MRTYSKGNMEEHNEIENRIEELERSIKALPAGYVSRKLINGKERLYLQWREGKKIKSRYIKEGEKEVVLAGIARRREMEEQLRILQKQKYTVAEPAWTYNAAPIMWLKWQNTVIGEIDGQYNVRFVKPDFNETVRFYTRSGTTWTRPEFTMFLTERVVSPSRRDIEQILHRCGLKEYDVLRIALVTRGICARDMLWIAKSKEERFEDTVTDVFASVFMQKKDLQGNSVDTPEGQNIKRYGVCNGHYGIYKKRLSPITTDIESELAVFMLAENLGVPCCPCVRVDRDTVFSQFCYDFGSEYIVHFRRLVGDRKHKSEFQNLLAVRPQYLPFIVKMTALDYITRQDDRHLSNIAIKVMGSGEEFYPLYDNGRSLFYEDDEETVKQAVKTPDAFVTAFGPSGTFLDCIREISVAGIRFQNLLNLSITDHEIADILVESGFKGYRFNGAKAWIRKTIDSLRTLDEDNI